MTKSKKHSISLDAYTDKILNDLIEAHEGINRSRMISLCIISYAKQPKALHD